MSTQSSWWKASAITRSIWWVRLDKITNGKPVGKRASMLITFSSIGNSNRRHARRGTPAAVGHRPLTTGQTRSSRSSSRRQTVRSVQSRSLCTQSIRHTRRTVTIRPHEQYRRVETEARAGKDQGIYSRSMPSEPVSRAPSPKGFARWVYVDSRYIGQEKTHLQQVATAAALNVVRSMAWFDGRSSRSDSPFFFCTPL